MYPLKVTSRYWNKIGADVIPCVMGNCDGNALKSGNDGLLIYKCSVCGTEMRNPAELEQFNQKPKKV